jgi:hypothetical protein
MRGQQISRMAQLFLASTALVVLTGLGSSASAAADPGTLAITKEVTQGAGPDAGVFLFSGSWGEDFALAAGASRSLQLPEGSYSFSERPEPGYTFAGIECLGPTGRLAFATPSATVPLAAGQTTSCTSASEPIIDIDVGAETTGNARLRSRRSCLRPGRLVLTVEAGNANWVSFRVGYRWKKTVRRPVRGSIFRLVTSVGRGAVATSARVRFLPGANPQEARLSKRVGSCLWSPAFAGGMPPGAQGQRAGEDE